MIIVTKFIAIAQETLLGLPLAEAVKRVDMQYCVDSRTDLNRVSRAELERQKNLMHISFAKHAIAKNSPDFIYDKQLSFNPLHDSAWDDEVDDD